MPSSGKTPNIGLNQWTLADKPKMQDFNSDNQILDSHVTAVNRRIDYLNAGNLLINGKFTVWQRAASVAAPTNAYTADRWKASGSGTVSRTNTNGGMTVTGSVTLSYTMETVDYAAISGRTVTLTLSQFGVVQSETFMAASATVFNKTFTNASLDWVWLALGTEPTVNPTWRPYAQELALCQRYYQIVTGLSATSYIGFGACVATAAPAQFTFGISLPVPLRATATVSLSSDGTMYAIKSDFSANVIESASSTGHLINPSGVEVFLNTSGSAATALYFLRTSAKKIFLDAEIY
jgi:hypothetical protein